MKQIKNWILSGASVLGSFVGIAAPPAQAAIVARTGIPVSIDNDNDWYTPANFNWSATGLSNPYSPNNGPGSLLMSNQNTWMTNVHLTPNTVYFGVNMKLNNSPNARNQVLFQDEIGTRSLSVEIRQNQLLFNNGNGTLTLNDPRIVAGTSYRTIMSLTHVNPTQTMVSTSLWSVGNPVITLNSLQNNTQLPQVISLVTPLLNSGSQLDEMVFGTLMADVWRNPTLKPYLLTDTSDVLQAHLYNAPPIMQDIPPTGIWIPSPATAALLACGGIFAARRRER
jgi:hypothetical protein